MCSALLLLSTLVVPSAITFYLSRRRSTFGNIPGPSPKSWLFGNMLELILHSPYGKHEFEWQKAYGTVYSIKGCIGEDRLMVSDTAALRHVLADIGDFKKCPQHQLINKHVFGDGSVLYAHGADHRRLRSAMAPAFSTRALRDMIPRLQEISEGLRGKWEKAFESNLEDGGVVDIFHDIHETTLKAVTQCVVGYDMSADKAYTKSYENLVITGAKRSKMSILTHSILLALPEWVVTALTYMPPRDFAVLLNHRKVSDTRSDILLKSKLEARKLGINEEKTLFDVMLDNYDEAPEKVTMEEIRNQFGTITVAGEDTTANALIWALYELARNPQWQERLREEVNTALESSKEQTLEFYDQMPFLNGLIKEVVRLYSTVPYTERIAVRDTIIPLSCPIKTRSGTIITHVPIMKGQYVVVAISSFNRLPSIWGEDADQFNPFRWLGLSGSGIKSADGAIGPYANLLTFIGGPRTCLGWRFAVLEMQILLCDLVRYASFEIPRDSSIESAHAISLVPLRMDANEKIGMPLNVCFL